MPLYSKVDLRQRGAEVTGRGLLILTGSAWTGVALWIPVCVCVCCGDPGNTFAKDTTRSKDNRWEAIVRHEGRLVYDSYFRKERRVPRRGVQGGGGETGEGATANIALTLSGYRSWWGSKGT